MTTTGYYICKLPVLEIWKYTGKLYEINSDFSFNVFPELPRILIVLVPIENEIINYFMGAEVQLEKWEKPLLKIAYKDIMKKYDSWFSKIEKDWFEND